MDVKINLPCEVNDCHINKDGFCTHPEYVRITKVGQCITANIMVATRIEPPTEKEQFEEDADLKDVGFYLSLWKPSPGFMAKWERIKQRAKAHRLTNAMRFAGKPALPNAEDRASHS